MNTMYPINNELWLSQTIGGSPVEDESPALSDSSSGHRVRTGLFAASLFAMSLVGFGVDYLFQPHRFPLVSIEVHGTENAQPNHVREAIAAVASSNIFRIDLVAVAQAAQTVPWVADATVRRRWRTGTLEIDVHERVISARWNNDFWLDDGGNPVVIPDYENRNLPSFGGPDSAAGEMLDKFSDWQGLLDSASLKIKSMSRSGRGSWELEIEAEQMPSANEDAAQVDEKIQPRLVRVILGSIEPDSNVARLTRLQDVLARHGASIASVDMRHPDGVAVRWKNRPELDVPSIEMSKS